ncbi:MAG: radical SAM protein [Acidobacteria bacterium]|nr:radical SAM protein [Acidobacteriota bacterium]
MSAAFRVLLLSTYELGRQPFGLASPAAWLRRAGAEVHCLDLSRDRLDADLACTARLVAIYLPMHTATRLAIPVIDRLRALNPTTHLCCFGLYAPPNEAVLRARGVESVLGAEFEADLVAVAQALASGKPPGGRSPGLPRLAFIAPDRTGLPPLTRYAALDNGHDRVVVGYTEASRGCKHLCRHCPVVPVYQGQFRVVPVDVVLADIRAQVNQGARHITFGDPDFFNGIGHALRVVDAVRREFPRVTYDVTIKIEHLLRHCDLLPRLRDTGCLFVTSAVESVDDAILARLEKGHTRDDFIRVSALCRDAGLTLSPTFVAFTPWTSLEGYAELLQIIEALDLVDHVAPIQLAIRLLVTSGSRLLELPDIQALIGGLDEEALTYRWAHPDPRVDALQRDIMTLVGARPTGSRRDLFGAISDLTRQRVGSFEPEVRPATAPARNPATIPYLTEPWYC